MGYFDNLDNELSNKYKKKLKLKKKLYGYVLLLIVYGDSNFMQFYYCLVLQQGPSKFYIIYNDHNMAVLDGLSNNNEIA
jgi:hypothetical protein